MILGENEKLFNKLLKENEYLEKQASELRKELFESYDLINRIKRIKSEINENTLLRERRILNKIWEDLEKVMLSDNLTEEDLKYNSKETLLLLKDFELFYNKYIDIYKRIIRNNLENNDLNKLKYSIEKEN